MTSPVDDDVLAAVIDHVDAHEEDFLARLIEYLRHPSISATGEGIREVADILVGWLTDLGFETALEPTAAWPIVLGRRIEDPALPTVLLYGHYDVQPPEPLESWESPPFEPTVRDGRLYARGVGDNKGQHAANLFAVETLIACTGSLPCNVIFLLEGEEETGSPHIADFIAEHELDLPADLVIVSDGPVHTSGRSTIVFGVRGVVSFELRATGANKDLHSGGFGNVAPNPLWTLVHLLATMKNEAGQITIDGFFDDVDEPSPLEQEILAKLPVDEAAVKTDLGLTRFDEPDRPFHDRLSVWPTLTINGIHGGYGGPRSKTVLPSEAIAKCDVRLVGDQTADDILDKVEAHVKRHAPEVTFVRQAAMDPSKTPLDSPYAPILRRAITTAQGAEPLDIPSLGGSLPNYVFTKILGRPTFVVPYANADEDNHAPNENMELWRIPMAIKTGASILLHLAGAPKSRR